MVWDPYFIMSCGCCVWILPRVLENFFFLYMDPLTRGGRPRSELRVPPVAPPAPRWPLAGEDLAVFMLVGLFSGTSKI